jgi:hypothetical protein
LDLLLRSTCISGSNGSEDLSIGRSRQYKLPQTPAGERSAELGEQFKMRAG